MASSERPPRAVGNEVPRPIALQVDLDGDEHDLLARAAKAAGKEVATYVLERSLAAARRDADLSLESHVKTYRWSWCTHCVLLSRGVGVRVLSDPAPCCGGTPSLGVMWPSNGITHLFAIDRLDLEDAADVRTATMFLAAACEAIMSETLWHVYGRLRVPRSVANALDDNADTRKRQNEQYRWLVGEHPQRVCERTGHGAWFAAWEKLVAARNELVHGDPGVKSIDPVALRGHVEVVHAGAIDAFADLHNAAITSCAAQLTVRDAPASVEAARRT